MYQAPFHKLHYGENDASGWQQTIGVFRVWKLNETIDSTDYIWELILKSLMLVLIITQENIFNSVDYRRFLVSKLSKIRVVSPIKAFCLTFMYNNRKIKRIVKIQFEKKNMIKKLAIVKKQLSSWNDSFFNKFKDEIKSKKRPNNDDNYNDESSSGSEEGVVYTTEKRPNTNTQLIMPRK